MTISTPDETNEHLLLRSERLLVQIVLPGKYYAGSRFDWTGFITQVTLDGVHTFGIKESLTHGEGTGGEGFCNEFGISKPIGYDEASPGEAFPKLGVGVLARIDDKPYSFFTSYPVAPYPMRVTGESQSGLTFVVEPIACNGYAVKLEKTIIVRENRLTIDYRLANVGDKPIHTHEYCHNFVAIDREPIGPGYRLRLSDLFNSSLPEEMEWTDDGQIRWLRAPETPFYSRSSGPFAEGLQWELFHEARGVGLRESVNFSAMHIALWGTNHVVSPEVFIEIDLKPGQKMKWSRQYEFFTV